MFKEVLERMTVFEAGLQLMSVFARFSWLAPIASLMTNASAKINIYFNQPPLANDTSELADAWLDLMPPDGKEFFKIDRVEKDTAFVKIHLHCPLRDSGNATACYRLMNYDRKLMDEVGGQLVVLSSQSNSGNPFCELAIRPKNVDVSDLVPAHLQV